MLEPTAGVATRSSSPRFLAVGRDGVDPFPGRERRASRRLRSRAILANSSRFRSNDHGSLRHRSIAWEAVMRFAFLVAGGVAAGALAVGGVRTLVPPNAQMFQAVRALGGDMAGFKLGDIDP